ncbi:MAG: hypothetical protein ACJ8DI_25760 [Ktedonobacteraceae bacterium]
MANLIIVPRPGSLPVHYTNEHPFCADIGCPCHEDMDLIFVALMVPYDRGHLTTDEATLIYLDTQVSHQEGHMRQLLIHPLRDGRYVLVYTVESRHGLMFKHLPGFKPFGEQQKEEVVKHLGRGAFTFMQLRYTPYPY